MECIMNRFKLEEREIPPDMASWLDEVKADIVELKNSLGKLQIKVGKIDGSLDVLTAAKKPPHPWVTSAISFVGMALLGFWGWMAVTLVQHGNTLAGIRQSMLSLGITVAASSPLTPRSQNQATTA